MLGKAASLPADQIFFDLEDSVVPSQKEEARGNVVKALMDGDFTGKLIGARVNAVSTKWCHRDVIEVIEGAGERIDLVMIPKAERAADVTFVADLLRQLEETIGLERRVGLEVQIETAAGLTNADEIAAASDRNLTLIFGPADMSASLGMPALSGGLPQPDYPGDHFHFALARILVAARNAGLQAIDGPYLAINDLEGFRASALRARALGFDGKWALHPSQIEILNEVFSPSREEFDKALAIIGAHERSAGEGGPGALMFGEEMIDEASRKMAERVIASGRAAGMTTGPRESKG